MIVEIMNIVAGLVLAMGILPNIPAVGKSLEKVAKWLGLLTRGDELVCVERTRHHRKGPCRR